MNLLEIINSCISICPVCKEPVDTTLRISADPNRHFYKLISSDYPLIFNRSIFFGDVPEQIVINNDDRMRTTALEPAHILLEKTCHCEHYSAHLHEWYFAPSSIHYSKSDYLKLRPLINTVSEQVKLGKFLIRNTQKETIIAAKHKHKDYMPFDLAYTKLVSFNKMPFSKWPLDSEASFELKLHNLLLLK